MYMFMIIIVWQLTKYLTVFWENIGYIYIMDSDSDLELTLPERRKMAKNIDWHKNVECFIPIGNNHFST